MLKSTTQAEASNTPDTTNRIDAPDTQSVVVDAWTSLVRSKSTRNRSLSSAAAAKHDMFVSTTTAALSPSSTSDFADVTHSSTIIDDLQRQLAERDQDIELAASIGQGLLEEVAALQIKCRELEDRLVRTGATVDAGDGTVYMRDEHVENETARFETTGQHSPVHFEARGNSPRKALHRLETPGSRRRRLLDASEDIAPRTLFQSACDDTAASGAETRLVSTSQVDQLREMDGRS